MAFPLVAVAIPVGTFLALLLKRRLGEQGSDPITVDPNVDPGPAPNPTPTPNPTPKHDVPFPDGAPIGAIVGDGVLLRISPSRAGGYREILTRGSLVANLDAATARPPTPPSAADATAVPDGWWAVQAPSGNRGYVAAQFVNMSGLDKVGATSSGLGWAAYASPIGRGRMKG